MNFSQCSVIYFSYRVYFEPIFSEAFSAVLATVFLGVITAVALITNFAFVVAMLFRRHFATSRDRINNLRTTSSIPQILMTSLATCDFLGGLIATPLGLTEFKDNGRWVFGPTLCTMRLYATYWWAISAVWHVNCMAIDRYLAICKPFLYRRLSKRTAYVMIAVSWAVPSLVSAWPYIDSFGSSAEDLQRAWNCTGAECTHKFRDVFIVIIVLSFCIPFVTSYIVYIFIIRNVMKLSKSRKQLTAKYELSLPQETERTFDTRKNKTIQKGENESSSSISVIVNSSSFGFCLLCDISETSTSINKISENFEILKIAKSQETAIFVDGYFYFENQFQRPSTENIESNTLAEVSRRSAGSLFNHVFTPSKTTSASSTPVASDANDRRSTSTQGGTTQKTPRSFRRSPNLKAYKTVGCLVLCFTICWCPSWSFIIVFFKLKDDLPLWLVEMVIWFAYTNAAINPFLYCCNRSVRCVVKNLIKTIYMRFSKKP